MYQSENIENSSDNFIIIPENVYLDQHVMNIQIIS